MRKIILSTSVIFLLWCVGFGYYINYTKSYRIDNNTITDAIVVFAGGRQRLNTGISLLKAGYAPILFISGVESQTQLKNFLEENNIKLDQVIYGPNATKTKDDIKEIAEFVTNYEL